MKVERTSEISKYIKKRESDTSKANLKSKHKHIYQEALIDELSYGIVGIGTYCTICGKLNNLVIPHDILEDEYGARYRSLTKEEIRVRYSHLPHFTIDNWYKTNMTSYTSKLADETFCNDRSITSGSGYLTTSTTIYGAYNRLQDNKKPSLKDAQDDIVDSLYEEATKNDANIVSKAWAEIRKNYNLKINDKKIKEAYDTVVKSYNETQKTEEQQG